MLYQRWDLAHTVPMWPGGPNFAQLQGSQIDQDDDEVRLMLEADPEEHAVEYLGQFRSARNSYLPLNTVTGIFEPVGARILTTQTAGTLNYSYVAHGDPSTVGNNFGFAIGHIETVDGVAHVFYDVVHAWEPSEFTDNKIDYSFIEDEIYRMGVAFNGFHLSFDQFNSAQIIQRLERRLQEARLPRRPTVEERTATAADNWRVAEVFKAAANMGLIHAPDHRLARLELEYLQRDGHKVSAPDKGPVRTDDLADAMMQVAYVLLQQQAPDLFARLSGLAVRGSQPGGLPSANPPEIPEAHLLLSAAGRRSVMSRVERHNPARGKRSDRPPHLDSARGYVKR
jgi:hypothetical protein